MPQPVQYRFESGALGPEPPIKRLMTDTEIAGDLAHPDRSRCQQRLQPPFQIYTLRRVHTWGFQVVFLFLGLGQTLFSYLSWRSRFIPRWLAGLGIVASSIMTVVALGIIIWPRLYSLVTMAYMAPMGIYEIVLGLWLLILGIRPVPSAQ